MKLFGKPLSSYIRFAGPVAGLVFAVGAARLALSLSGMPDERTRWLSMTVLTVLGMVYLSIRTQTAGFGSYRHLLPVVMVPNIVMHLVAIIGIAIAIFTGEANVFTAPDFSRGTDGRNWGHAGAHLGIGIPSFGLLLWLAGCLILLITRTLTKRRVTVGA